MSELHTHFDELFTLDEDPWNYRSSWPERRRLDLLVAMLPDERYDAVFEPACANGTLTARLATRAKRLVAWDGSTHAVAHARRHLSAFANVEFGNHLVPDDWPDSTFDLIVLSDFLYYLPSETIADVAAVAFRTLRPKGSIAACHWLGSAHDFQVAGGRDVHRVLTTVLGVSNTSSHDPRHVIDVWTP